MSWIFGVINNGSDNNKFPGITGRDSAYSFNDEFVSLYAGGNKDTTFFNYNKNLKKGWVVAGVGITEYSNDYKLIDNDKWNVILDDESFEINKIYGHYVIIKWDERILTIYSDKLGLRDIYLVKQNNKIIFSTRLDWLANSINAEIDFKVFGSRWLLFNQISSDSILSNTTRISSGDSATIDIKKLDWAISKKYFLPSAQDEIPDHPVNEISGKLNKLINIPFNSGSSLSLSLSGGMDSRVLLSFLLKYGKNNKWDAHTFGGINNPDVVIANKIADHLNIRWENFNAPLQPIEDCIKGLIDYCGQMAVSNPSSAILQLNNYEFLKSRLNTVFIDGGFGEIWRREFLNRLFIRDKNALLNREYENILPHLTIHRANIFTDDINDIMFSGCLQQLENMFEELPDICRIGVENWLDLFAIKTRLLNFYNHEQARVDGIVKSYMPFIQIPLLDYLFVTPVKVRKNAKLFRQLIKNNYRALLKFGLAKGSTIHPVFLTTLQSRLWNVFSKKMNINQYKDNSKQAFILHLKEYINDLISSKDVEESGYYNYQKLQHLSSSLMKEEAANINIHELDWWLSFEIFRQQIVKQHSSVKS